MRILFLLIPLMITAEIEAQLVSMSPEKPALGADATLYFDATAGNGDLMGYNGDVYVHTGLITNESTGLNDWRKIVANWTDNKPSLKMERVASDRYQLPVNISDLYGVAATGGNVVGLAMVFRSADGSRVGRAEDGGDIYYWFKQPTFSGPSQVLKVSQTPHPDWADKAVIYEVNVRQYSADGTIRAFADHLPRLAGMGVDILWIMPVQPIGKVKRKGSLGSYYSIADYTAINPEMGTTADFKAMVDQAHKLGMKVTLDWVANHSAFDHHWADEHPDYYNRDEDGNQVSPYDWSDVADLNYDNADLRQAMIDEMAWWLTEMDIDGFRCDVAGEVDTPFWEEARKQLEAIKPIWMLAENGDKMDLLNHAFNANYAWDMHHDMNAVAKGDKDVTAIYGYLAWATSTLPQGTYPMHFISNHDENSWKGTVYERMGDGHKAFAVLCFTAPGMPLIYSGLEAGLDKRLAFFEKDEIDWTDLSLMPFYTKLAELKHTHSPLWNGSAGGSLHRLGNSAGHQVMTFGRKLGDQKVLVMINLSPEPHTISVGLGQFEGSYTDYFSGETASLSSMDKVRLGSWEYRVYVR